MSDDLQQLGAELISTAGRIVRWAPNDGVEMGLAAARVIAHLRDVGPLRISDLAERERCSQPTMSNHIQRLERAGLVKRQNDATDGRVSVISLTPAGYDELRRIRERIGKNLVPELGHLSAEELDALREGIEIMQRLVRHQPVH